MLHQKLRKLQANSPSARPVIVVPTKNPTTVPSPATTTIMPSYSSGRSFWTLQRATSTASALAGDLNGEILLMGASGGAYISHDFGSTWTLADIPYHANTIIAVTCSHSGQFMLATRWYVGVYISTDFGETWAATGHNPASHYNTLASDSTGQYHYIVGGFNPAPLTTSSDYGSTWQTAATGSTQLTDIWCDDSGMKLIGRKSATQSVVSANRGVTWSNIVGVIGPHAIDRNAGLFLVGTTSSKAITLSTNFGTTWSQVSNSPVASWLSFSCSNLCQKIAASSSDSGIFVSTDFGSTWSLTSAAQDVSWSSVWYTGAGDHLFAAGDSSLSPEKSGVYTSYFSTTATSPTMLPFTWPVTSPTAATITALSGGEQISLGIIVGAVVGGVAVLMIAILTWLFALGGYGMLCGERSSDANSTKEEVVVQDNRAAGGDGDLIVQSGHTEEEDNNVTGIDHQTDGGVDYPSEDKMAMIYI